jgi:hypothetical protein
MDERDREELRALCDQFREAMGREVDQELFDSEARVRIGGMISRLIWQGRSDYDYGSRP